MAAVEPMVVKVKISVDVSEAVEALRKAADALEKLQPEQKHEVTVEEVESGIQRISEAQTPTHLILLEAVDGAATTFRLEDPFTRGTHKYLVKRGVKRGAARKHPAGSTWYRVPDRPGHFRRDDEEIELLDIVFPDA